MQKLLVPLLVLAVVLPLAGCGGDDDEEAQDALTVLTDTTRVDTAGAAETLDEILEDAEEALEDALTLDLQEQNGSGVGGTVELSPSTDGTLTVMIELTGDDGSEHPAHVHPGSCADLDPTPKWPLENVVDGTSTTTIDVSLDDVEAEEYAVNIHESPEDSETYIACADVRSQ